MRLGGFPNVNVIDEVALWDHWLALRRLRQQSDRSHNEVISIKSMHLRYVLRTFILEFLDHSNIACRHRKCEKHNHWLPVEVSQCLAGDIK